MPLRNSLKDCARGAARLRNLRPGCGGACHACAACRPIAQGRFVAPQANLLNDDGRLVGTHFIGPTWRGNDGSSVVGQKVAAASVDPSAVPWLLLTRRACHSRALGTTSRRPLFVAVPSRRCCQDINCFRTAAL